ncbi:MAG: hypothetical protein QOI82_3449 [Actinomycetota bacterium]|jgi:hypothetical protein|nr:hypothetical protein [Actinomycetota bacterium]
MRARLLVVPVALLALAVGPIGLVAGLTPASAATTTGSNGFAPPVPLNDAAGASTSGSEPSIHIDSKDNVYVSAPVGVPTGGCPFWYVHPDSANAAGLPYDYRGTIDTDHASVGGGDCDISSTPVSGSAFDDVSVTSLSLANLTSNVTTDGGATFTAAANPASQQVFGVDRQWQASDPALGVHYLTVHDLATDNVQTSVSSDGGYQYVQNTPAIDPTVVPGAASTAVGLRGTTPPGNHFGPLAVGPGHKLYIPFIAPGRGETGGTQHAIWVAEGDPCAVTCQPGVVGPITWTDHLAYAAPAGLTLANDFPSLTVDKGGVVYVAFTGDVGKPASTGPGPDHNHIFVAHTVGNDLTNWNAPTQVDPGSANSNVFPWLVSGAAGNVGVAWYASTLATATTCPGGVGTAANNPVSDNCRNVWHVAYAQSTNAATTAPDWSLSDVSGDIHHGPICNQGLACATGTRTLLDFFDVAVDSQGRPNFVYVSDTRALGTPDIQYTRQCSGTSLTGTTLTSPCGPLGTPPVCASNGAYSDPAGDATSLLGTTTPLPSDDAFDVVSGSLSSTTDGIVFSVKLKDLTSTPDGQIVEQHFKIAGKEYYVMAQRSTGDGALSFVYGDLTGTAGTRNQLGTTTGVFDDAADLVTTVFPRSATDPELADGTVISDVIVTTRRDGVVIIPDVDTAKSGCPYVVGAANDPVLPEVPFAALLPLLGLVLMGVIYRRRREA